MYRHVLLVEDIVESGRTLKFLQSMFESRQPASLKLATMLHKPFAMKVKDLNPDYVGYVIYKSLYM